VGVTAIWEDVVTVALLGTDRRPVPDGLPAGWAGPSGPVSDDPTQVLLGYAARHRAAVRAGSRLPTGPPTAVAPAEQREVGPPETQQELADALQRGTAGPVNDALAVLVDRDAIVAAEQWTALATLAVANPRVDRALLGAALGVRGVWFVGQNPQWARLATGLRNRMAGATS
jgi:hypothetical protein